MPDDFPLVGTRSLKPGVSILNPDGSRSSEKTISVDIDGIIQLIPTIIIDDEGFLLKVSNDDAIKLFREGKNPSIGAFETEEKATAFAIKRSKSGGRNAPSIRYYQ